ncbi:beta-ribofuranosylaminobenzene 5'-phosphate synthase [Allorhodopirellula solitaria]|uniref:GHMP kinase C-terminal domain-containing protein n=1 Tax=Allorhodopirellula solitaria TaxID=2527987 RepID=A0A5C5YDB3_9BACT|nr:beta-ribofuranosylaminobenzene 5'-phosphate synthase [Allorhodopirellula solitaria]TWT72929.1 hypothetical protein CA85_13900 [Allorhodopirellula solitaria]
MTNHVRITTGARLHFGLLDVAAPFGGCGVMIDRPNTIVTARRASEFSCTASADGCEQGSRGHLQRATAIAQRIAHQIDSPARLPPVHVEIMDAAPSHTGLGSGTQLSLAIAESILRVSPDTPSPQWVADTAGISLADGEIWLRAADRGRRSAVGTHGYLAGGFIAEGLTPSRGNSLLNTLDTRLEMPPAWRVSLLLPVADPGQTGTVSGDQEQAKFDALPTVGAGQRAALADILTTQILPAIQSADFNAFCAATTEYNYRSGELFASVQGGAYNGEPTTRLVTHLRSEGYTGVGQSSWGPGVFVWHPDDTSALAFHENWNRPEYRVLTARPQSTGRTVDTIQ